MSHRDLIPAPVPAAAGKTTAKPGEVSEHCGQPLEGAARSSLERSFGADFSSVRVHADHPAAPQMGAAAFTVGADISFSPGAYAPQTPQGYRLIAHELAHVMQNLTHPGASTSVISHAGDRSEAQADGVASLVAQGIHVGSGIQYAQGAAISRAETWYRGEGVGVAPSSPGGSLHDFGDGLYLTDSMDVAAQYAGTRAADNKAVSRILKGEIEPSRMGRVLDLTKDPRWEKYIKTPPFPGAQTPENLIKGANENYSRFFTAFLRENSLKIDDFDAIIGPEYVRGGKQMCVRSKSALDHVRSVLTPIEPPSGGGGPRGSGGNSGESGEQTGPGRPPKPPVAPGPKALQTAEHAEQGAEKGIDKAEVPRTRRAPSGAPHESAPVLSAKQQIAGMAANMAAGAALGIFQSMFKEKMMRDLDALPKPKIDKRSAGDMMRDPAVKSSMSLLDVLSKNFTPFGKELQTNQQQLLATTNLEVLALGIASWKSQVDFDRNMPKLNAISERLSADDDLLTTVQDNVAAVLAKEEKSLQTKKAADDLREFLKQGIVVNWLFEQGFSVEEISQLDSNLAYISASIAIAFRDAHALKDVVDKLLTDEQTLAGAVNKIRWSEIFKRANDAAAEQERNKQKAPKTP